MEIWEITIYCVNGPAYSILGDEDTFEAELVAWHAYESRDCQRAEEAQDSFQERYIDTEGFNVRRIKGFSHDVARFPSTLGYRFNEVQGMTVARVR